MRSIWADNIIINLAKIILILLQIIFIVVLIAIIAIIIWATIKTIRKRKNNV